MTLVIGRLASPDNKRQSDRVLALPLVSELPGAQGLIPSLRHAPAAGSEISQTGFLPIG